MPNPVLGPKLYDRTAAINREMKLISKFINPVITYGIEWCLFIRKDGNVCMYMYISVSKRFSTLSDT